MGKGGEGGGERGEEEAPRPAPVPQEQVEADEVGSGQIGGAAV